MELDGPTPERPPRHEAPSGGGGRPPIGTLRFAGMPVDFVVYTNGSSEAMARNLDKLGGKEGLPAYGAWSDPVVAERAMSMALDRFGKEIYSWLRDPGPLPFIRDFTVGFNVGKAITRDEVRASQRQGRAPVAVDTPTFRFQLRIAPEAPGFYITAAEPLPPLPTEGVVWSPLQTYEVQTGDDPHARGHTLTRHVNAGFNAAVVRLRDEPEIRAAGSFNDESTAQAVVNSMLQTYGREIAGWLVNSGDWMPFTREMFFPAPTGWVLDRDEFDRAAAEHRPPVAQMATGARLVMRKSDDFPEGFYVVTVYPVT